MKYEDIIYAPLDFGFNENFFLRMKNKLNKKINKKELVYSNNFEILKTFPIKRMSIWENRVRILEEFLDVKEFKYFWDSLFFLEIFNSTLNYFPTGSTEYHQDIRNTSKDMENFIQKNDPCSVKLNLKFNDEYDLYFKRFGKEKRIIHPPGIRTYLATERSAYHTIISYDNDDSLAISFAGILDKNYFRRKIEEMYNRYSEYFLFKDYFD